MTTAITILYLVPDLFGPPGGIARYCRIVGRALTDGDCRLVVVSLKDDCGGVATADAQFPTMVYRPCRGSKASFIWQSVIAALRYRPAVIVVGHAHFAPLGWMLSRCVAAPMITFVYGVDVWHRLSHLRRWAIKRAGRIISISRFTAEQVVRANGISPDSVRILPNCLDPQFASVPRHCATRSERSMLTVSRISFADQYKGHDYVIRAMAQLLPRFPELVYDIVGDGPARAGLELLARQEGVEEAVRFHGTVSEEELLQQYARAALFIMPSRKEGFGFVFLEAMANGTPVIGGNQDATPEVIVDGETGLLVDPTSVDAIVEAVSYLLSDEGLRLRMGQQARQHAHKNFSFDVFQERLMSYVSELSQVQQQ